MSKNIKEQIVKSINLQNNNFVDKDNITQSFQPRNAYLLPKIDGTHERFVTDDNNIISKQAGSSGGGTGDITKYINVSKTELDSLINNSNLEIGCLYIISQVDPNLYGGTTIYLTAINEDTISENGIGEFYNPKYDQSVAGFNVWSPNPPLVTPLVSFGSHYNVGDKVHWGGKTWVNVNGNVGNSIDIFTLDSEWQVIPYNENDYNKVYDEIKYDYNNDVIIYRNEKNSNIVSTNYANIQMWLYDRGLYNPIKVFMWGNTFNLELYVGIGNQEIISSYNENLNFRGSFQQYLIFKNESYQENISFESNSSQSYLNFNTSNQRNLTFENNSRQGNITLKSNSTQSYLTFKDESYQYNLIFNNSFQENLNFENNSYQRNLTFNNNSNQDNLTFVNHSYQRNLTFDNSYQQYLDFSNNSYQEHLIFEKGSYQTTFPLDNLYQRRLTFNNFGYERYNNHPTANEENLTFIGDLPEATAATKMLVYENNQMKQFPIPNNNLKYSLEEQFLGSHNNNDYYGKSFYWEFTYDDYGNNITENVYFDLTDLNISTFLEVSGTKQINEYNFDSNIQVYGEVQQMIAGVNYSVTNQAIFHTFNHDSPIGIQNVALPNFPRTAMIFFSIVYVKGNINTQLGAQPE